jgi:hypothetical protein
MKPLEKGMLENLTSSIISFARSFKPMENVSDVGFI